MKRFFGLLLGLLLLSQQEVRAGCSKLEPESFKWVSLPRSWTVDTSVDHDEISKHRTGIVELEVDGLKQYLRVDVPSQPVGSSNADGGISSIIVFVHGWVPQQSRSLYQMGLEPDSYYGPTIQRLAQSGSIVISPFLRGHGFSASHQSAQVLGNDPAALQRGYVRDITAIWTYRTSLLNWVSGQRLVRLSPSYRFAMFGHSMGANAVMQTILSSCVQSDTDRVAVVLWSGGYVELDAMHLRLNQAFVVWLAYGDKDRYVDVHKLGRQSRVLRAAGIEAYDEPLAQRDHELSLTESKQLAADEKDEYQRLFLNRTIKFLQDGIYQSN